VTTPSAAEKHQARRNDCAVLLRLVTTPSAAEKGSKLEPGFGQAFFEHMGNTITNIPANKTADDIRP
jgi:hypothetical protein